MSGDTIIEVKDVVNRFGNQTVHDGISFTIKRGEIIGIVGGSGSGKSVLLKTLIGLRKPASGEVFILGKPVGSISPAQAAGIFGVLFQEGALFSSLTVAQNIMLGLREHTDLTEAQQGELAQLKLALAGMPGETAHKYPSELSGGMVKRVALARALAMDPVILFLDEPTAGLDPVNASAFDAMIVELNRALGVTVVMATHDLDTLFTICDRVAALVEGKVIIDTLPQLLKIEQPWIQEFFQGPRARGAMFAAQQSEESHGKR